MHFQGKKLTSVTPKYTYIFTRRLISTGLVDYDLSILSKWISTKEIFMDHLHQVQFQVEGYTDDSRALPRIPELTNFFLSLNAKWPYFMNFSFPDPDSFSWWFHLSYLDPYPTDDSRSFGGFLDVERVEKFFTEWFEPANRIAEELNVSIPSYLNKQKVMIETFNRYLKQNTLDI